MTDDQQLGTRESLRSALREEASAPTFGTRAQLRSALAEGVAPSAEPQAESPTSIPGRITKGLGRGVVQLGTVPAKLAGAAIDLENKAESAVLDPVWRALGLQPNKRTLSSLVTGEQPKPVTGGVVFKKPAELVEQVYETLAPVTPPRNWKERAVDIGSEIAGPLVLGGVTAAGRRGISALRKPAATGLNAITEQLPAVKFAPGLLTGKPTMRLTAQGLKPATTPMERLESMVETTKAVQGPPPTPEALVEDLFPAASEIPGGVPTPTTPSRFWPALRDETGHLSLGKSIDVMKAWATKQSKKLPQEMFVLRQRPDSPVITEVERYQVGLADRLKGDVVESPWFGAVRQMNPTTLNHLEEQAVRAWEAGGRTPEAMEQAIAQWPPALRQYVQSRNAALRGEQAARDYLGLEAIPETPGPYLPRLTDAEARGVTQAGGQLGVGHGLQTTVKGAQHERVFATQLEGEAAGIQYFDRRNAILIREWNSLKLRQTAQLVRNLEGRALFRSPEAAKAVSGKAFAIEGIPGSKRWWTPTQAEAQFLAQNLKQQAASGPATFKHFADALFRNPNLLNPSPHVTKNMGVKALLARGPAGLYTIPRDMAEYVRGSNPDLIAEFKQAMPFSESGDPAIATLHKALAREPGLGATIKKAEELLGTINKPSSTVVFKWADPAMRYSLYKAYRGKGLSPMEAANNTWIDLVRYGTRSDLVDMWKGWPLNFFVPWRVGTITTLAKQGLTHPIRAAAIIGGIDYVREMRYRETGRWTHLPWDYLFGPVAQALESGGRSLAGTAGISAVFGPGGEMAARNMKDAIDELLKGDWGSAGEAFTKTLWGITQLAEAGDEAYKAATEGNPERLTNAAMSLLIGERNALKYEPKRLGKWIPESLPGMRRSPEVEEAEAIQEAKREKESSRQERRKDRLREDRGDTLVGKGVLGLQTIWDQLGTK